MAIRSRARRVRRIVTVSVFTLLALALVVAAAGYFVLSGSLPPLDGTERVAGLRDAVQLERDARGRLTVRARSREDLAFGLGYAHGQDRFFQMDLLRRAGEGTLAALIGASGVPLDRGARRHDLAGTARASILRASASEHAVLEAYTHGVNAGLASLRVRPWEYLALRQPPQPWRVVDALHVTLAMYRDLQDESNRRERALDVASRVLDPAVFGLFTATSTPWEAPVEGAAGPGPTARIDARGPGLHGDDGRSSTPASDRPATEGSSIEPAPRGSNSWAVAGTHTADGRAILANDMHLGLGVPNTWYAARLIVEGDPALDAVGVTLAGTPALVVGSNGAIAWGFTNSYGDWLDHVVLEFDPADSTRYRDGERWHHLVERRERIEVARSAAVELRVQQTIWGPVVGRDTERRPLALRWTAQEPEALDLHLLGMMEQSSIEQALELAPRCGIPHQNFVVAGRDGRIAWTVIGRVPRRVGLEGPRPRSWADGDAGWKGWLDPEEVPRIESPEHGRLWTANARVLSEAEQPVLGDGGYAVGARARRIRDRLFAIDAFDEAAMLAIQFDIEAELMSSWCERLRALVRVHPEIAHHAEVERILDGWTGQPGVDSVSYRLVRDWRGRMLVVAMGAIGVPMQRASGEDLVWSLPRLETALWALVRDRPDWIPGGHESWDAFELAALDEVLTNWGDPRTWHERTWGKRNALVIRHALSPALPDWLAAHLDLPVREVPGDSFVPRVDGGGFGASERMVVAPGAEERGILTLPGGPNAHPLAPHRYGDFDAWRRGETVPLLPGPPVHTRRLEPRSSR